MTQSGHPTHLERWRGKLADLDDDVGIDQLRVPFVSSSKCALRLGEAKSRNARTFSGSSPCPA